MSFKTNREARPKVNIDNFNIVHHTSPGAAISVRVIEARLSINVARIGSMKPYVSINYGEKPWKTPGAEGMTPKWNAFHVFESNEIDDIEVSVLHKPVIFSDTLIGKVNIKLSQVALNKQTDWWPIFGNNGEQAGQILLAFDLDGDRRFTDSMAMFHGGNNSMDIREYGEDLLIQKRNYKKMREQRNQRASGELDELEILRIELSEEFERIKKQEDKVKRLFEKLKIESGKLKTDRNELKRSKQSLRQREENIIAEKQQLARDRQKIQEERGKLENIRQDLNNEYLRLKQEKLKIQTQRKILEHTSKRVGDKGKQVERQKAQYARAASQTSLDGSVNLRIQDEWEQIEKIRETLDQKHKELEQSIENVSRERQQLDQDWELLSEEQSKLEGLIREESSEDSN